jgi:predicted ribosomally synthesized peptide with nif11-like leader
MSEEQAKAFIERMKTDEEFCEKVLAVEGTEGRLALARAEGYDCSAEEIAAEGGKLSEEELDTVVGGVWGCDDFLTCDDHSPPPQL